MGIEEMKLGPGTFYIEDPETGKMQELCPVIGGELQSAINMGEVPKECSEKLVKALNAGEITISIDCPWNVVQYGKLSRKRFVKLLMSEGRSRNHANSLARSWREKTKGAPYYLEAIARSHYWGYKVRIGNCRIV